MPGAFCVIAPWERIAVLGPGAIGLLLATQLAADGKDVVLWGRDALAMRQIALGGITLDGVQWAHALVETAVGPLPKADLYVVTVKTTANAELARRLAQEAPPEALILVCQNGLDPEAAFAEVLGPWRIYRAILFLGARRLDPGHVELTFQNRPTVIGGVDEGVAKILASCLSHAGHPAEATRQLRREAWEKVILNAITNPLTALGGRTIREVMADPRFPRLLEEAIAVASADGMELGEGFAAHAWELCRRAGEHRSSMWEDVRSGRSTEIDQLNGRIVTLGDRYGVPTPTHQQVIAELAAQMKPPP